VKLDLEWWDKVKPMNLAGETVTVALRKLEFARNAISAKPTRENLVQLSGALKLLQSSMTQTKLMCNKAFQGACIKSLTQAEAVVQKAYNDVQGAQAKFTAELDGFQKQRNILASALNLMFMRKRLDQVPAALKALDAFLALIDQGEKDGRLSSEEHAVAVGYLETARSLMNDIENLKAAPTDVLTAKWAEFGEVTKKIGVLGGYSVQQAAATCYTLEI
jgi:hypothetical protein